MSATAAVAPSLPTVPRTRSILVVDDDAVVVKAMTVLLERAGYRTVGCVTAADALERACPTIAAAVLDIHLPDMNGLELSQTLRHRIGPTAPIIILSGDVSMQTIRALPDAGATYFFAKPVDTGMLIAKLKTWIDGDGL